MMTSNLTFVLNQERMAQLALGNLGASLGYSEEDVNLYFFMLAVISDKHPEIEKRNQAFKYLIKQDKLQNILNDLITRHQLLETESNMVLVSNCQKQKEITPQVEQLEQELDIFNELHFRVKRNYIRFAKEHFQASWGQSYMVA